MRAALLVAATDLRRRLRNRTVLLYGVAAPLVLSWIISLALGGGGSFSVTIGVADADGGL